MGLGSSKNTSVDDKLGAAVKHAVYRRREFVAGRSTARKEGYTVRYNIPRAKRQLYDSGNTLPWENNLQFIGSFHPIYPSTSSVPLYYAYGALGNSVFRAFLAGGLYDTSYYTTTAYEMVGFQPSKLAFLPMTPSSLYNGYPALDWTLVAMGLAQYEYPTNTATTSTSTYLYSVATVLALDPFTGQLKPSYSTDPTKPNMQRYTVPNVGTNNPTPLSLSPAGMVYHPNFGIMVFGPVTNTSLTWQGSQTVRNPFVLDPSHVNYKLEATFSIGQTNFGSLMVPDMAGVSFGNVAMTTQWLLMPSCDWDASHTPGNAALSQVLATPVTNVAEMMYNSASMTTTDVMASTLVLTNGTMMVETFPELGTVDSSSNAYYGLVSCGFSSSSTNTLYGIPGSQGTYGLFINLYYYYDPALYSAWPDTCSSPPVTSGWMMPRNVANACQAPSPVSGSALVNASFTCPSAPQAAGTQAGPGPYPAITNYLDATSPCMCLMCANDAPQESDDLIVPCAHILNFSTQNGLLMAQQASSKDYLNSPYTFMATWPDDPVHVAYTPNEPVTDGKQSGCTPQFGYTGSVVPALDYATRAGVPYKTQYPVYTQLTNTAAIGGQFVTWFDTTGNVVLPVSMYVYHSTIYIFGYSQGEDPTPYLYELGLVDLSYTPPVPASLITPTTGIQVLKVTAINDLIQAFTSNPANIGDLSGVELVSIAEMQIVDFGVYPTGPCPIMTVLGTLSTTSYIPGTGGYPAVSVAPDNNGPNSSGNYTVVGGPAILTFSLQPGQGKQPVLLEVDLLNANNRQNTNAGVMAPNNPLVRGLVRTNLSMPSFGVVSEAVQNTSGTNYCDGHVCDLFTIGDPIYNQMQTTAITPCPGPDSTGAITAATTQGPMPDLPSPIKYTWNSGTNAAMLSHIKLCLPPSTAATTLYTVTLDIQQYQGGSYKLSVQIGSDNSLTLQTTDPSSTSQQFIIDPTGLIIPFINRQVCLGKTDNATVSLVPMDANSTWTMTSGGQVSFNPSYGNLFLDVNPGGSTPIAAGNPIQLLTPAQGQYGANHPWAFTPAQQYAVNVPPSVLGNSTTFGDQLPTSFGTLTFPELPSLTPAPLQGTNPGNLSNQVPVNTQTVSAQDVLFGMQNVSTTNYKGWTQDLANRFRSYFRGQVLRPNLYGFVGQTLSFLPGDLLTSPNTDPLLMASLHCDHSLTLSSTNYANVTTVTVQQVLGYVLSWETLQYGYSTFTSYTASSSYQGTGVLYQSVVTPIFGPLASVAPNVIVHKPNSGSDYYVLPAFYPSRGYMSSPSSLAYFQVNLDPALTAYPTNNGRGASDSLLLYFPYVYTSSGVFSTDWRYTDPTSGGKLWLPRPNHPVTGLTTCTLNDATQRTKNTAADLDDYVGLYWVSEFLSSEPSAAPNNVFAQQNMVGWRSMFGLQPGNANLIGPGAYIIGNDQNMIPYNSGNYPWNAQVGFGTNFMTNYNGFYTQSSVNQAMCAPYSQ